MRARLASEIIGFAMLFGIVSAAGAALLHFVGEGLDSAGEAGESIIRQKISRLGESLRVIHSSAPEADAPSAWTARVEIVNAGDADIEIAGIHYVYADTVISDAGCSTMQKVTAQDHAGACTLPAGEITDMRFSPTLGAGHDGEDVGILLVTEPGNVIRLVGEP